MGNQGGQGKRKFPFFPLARGLCLSFSFQIKEEEL